MREGTPERDAPGVGLRGVWPHQPGGGRREAGSDANASDEALVQRLQNGEPDALGPLYSRYIGLVYHLSSQSLDHSAAEELVQEAFLIVWRKANQFDPARGTFRAWLLEIVHRRVLNELRRRSRRPHVLPGPGEDHLRDVTGSDPEPSEVLQLQDRRQLLAAALETLPPEQQRALWLAFFGELTHEQVATVTGVPLGTAKTRIRAGLRRLRGYLTPLLVGSVLVLLGGGALAYQREHGAAVLYMRALRHVTMSDLRSMRLVATPGTPELAHGVLRIRPGADIAVMTVSYLPPLAPGERYQAWVSEGGTWRTLGAIEAGGPEGRGLLLVDQPGLTAAPDVVQVTRESGSSTDVPSGAVVIQWTAP